MLRHRDQGPAPERERAGRVRVPEEGVAVAFARCEEAAGVFEQALHFAERGFRGRDVEEGLVREDDVEGGVCVGEAGEDVADGEGEVRVRGGGVQGAGLGDYGRAEVDAGDVSVGDGGGEAGGYLGSVLVWGAGEECSRGKPEYD